MNSGTPWWPCGTEFPCAALRSSSSAASLRSKRNRPAPSPSFLSQSRPAGEPGPGRRLLRGAALAAGMEPLLGLAKYLAYMNMALVLFNVIPGYPLDGGRVFRAIVWRSRETCAGRPSSQQTSAASLRFCSYSPASGRCSAATLGALAGVHRLVPRQRGVGPSAANDVSRPAGRPQGLTGHEHS